MNIKKLAITLSILLFLAAGYFLLKQGKEVSYEGVAVDAKTGLPISGAKVVVTTFPYGIWDASPTHTGTITENDGSFSIVATRDYWISKSTIASISQDKLFTREKIDLRTTNGCLRLRPLPETHMEIPGYSFKNFAGGWSGKVDWQPNGN